MTDLQRYALMAVITVFAWLWTMHKREGWELMLESWDTRIWLRTCLRPVVDEDYRERVLAALDVDTRWKMYLLPMTVASCENDGCHGCRADAAVIRAAIHRSADIT